MGSIYSDFIGSSQQEVMAGLKICHRHLGSLIVVHSI
jgi:hypothetical protein